jgi:2'-5' RNA ligase
LTLCDPTATDPINSFSLVSYIPGRLGEFITGLRKELVADCVAQSHVTVLPPRPLFIDQAFAEKEIRERVAAFSPVRLKIGKISVFEQTSVVFAEIGDGRDELAQMHDSLNSDGFYFEEPFTYHPHVTIAQGIPPDQLDHVFRRTRKRWQEEAPAATFMVDTLTFVQNTVGNRWMDLVECELRGEALMSVR